MSLQVQSSQPAATPSGRRTPQVYQNLVSNSSPSTPSTPPTNGNSSNTNKSSTGKLSLKSSSSGKSSPAAPSGKASPAPTQPPAVTVTVTPPTPQAAPAPVSTPQKVEQQVSDEKKASPVKDNAEKKEVTNGKETNGKHEEDATMKESPRKEANKASPRATPQKSIPVEQVKTPETVSPKKAAGKEVAAAPEASKKKVDNSLVAEKTLKGFTAEGDEMESLVVEPSEYEDSPMPPRTGGKSKLLKGAGPPTRARISPFRVAQEAAVLAANASTVVNLSTVSEGQHAESNESSPAVDFNRPLRAISGRRSTRPMTEIQFSYRKPVAELNDSSSSLNVTVGSEIHNDSLRTPAGSSRKRKAMTPESTSDALDVKEAIDSPKRTRLDFSGFLGIVASPVTMLKNRFSRVRLQASTPVAKRSFTTEEEDLVGKIVTAEATTTTANISGGGDSNKMEVETAESADKKPEDGSTIKEGQTEVPADADAAASKDTSTAEEAKEDTVEVKDVTDKQRRCIIM
uniref:Uncharacterized protein n=1 Tax=Culex tarsalis TaxID=7177 RepID=A0A1Q3F5W2_CULTA